jgi:hypothetical protein
MCNKVETNKNVDTRVVNFSHYGFLDPTCSEEHENVENFKIRPGLSYAQGA